MSLYGGSKPPPYDKQKFFTIFLSAHMLHSRPPTLLCGRADNACTNLLGFFVWCVRTRGSMRLRGAVKLPTFDLSFAARTCHALLLATNSCTREEFSKRGERSLWWLLVLFVTEKYDKGESYLKQKIKNKSSSIAWQRKILCHNRQNIIQKIC